MAAAAPSLAPAQTPLDELLEEQVEQQLESELAERLERAVEEQVEADVGEAIEQQIESGVLEAVEQQVESGVLEAIEQQVESGVLDAVEQQVESGVLDAVEQQVEEGVLEAVEAQVEIGVLDTLEQQVESDVQEALEQQGGSSLLQALERQIESGVSGALELEAAADLLGLLEHPLEGAVPEGALRRLEMLIEAIASGALELPGGVEGLDEALEGTLVEELREALAQAAANQRQDGSGDEEESAAAGQEPFLADLDDAGQRIERDVWLILVEPENAARIDDWGFEVRDRRMLDGLDLILLRVTAPTDRTLAEAALELALDSPGTVVDLNHMYVTSDDQAAGGDGSAAVTAAPQPVGGAPASIAPTRAVGRPWSAPAGGRPAVGILDTAIAVEHEALKDADIVRRDLVPFEGRRPAAHGTAVASILIGNSKALVGQIAGGRVYAASVFVEDEEGEPAAVTSSLVRGLSWLAEEGVSVINMSLAGPANRVLEAAVERAAASGAVLVAAVGNNGPAGEPLYPAAYGAVLGITAVDSRERIYRYANRGPHVAFAAPGVRIPVALHTGGYGTESGTSMAAPHAAAIIALSLAATGRPPQDVLVALERPTVAPSRRLRDDVFGYGVIAPFQ